MSTSNEFYGFDDPDFDLPVTIDERIDSTNIGDAVAIAEKMIADCERDIGRKLVRGEINDLLMDNTTWRRSEIVAVVDSLNVGAA